MDSWAWAKLNNSVNKSGLNILSATKEFALVLKKNPFFQ